MLNGRRYAKVNIKVLVILILITAAIVTTLFAARQIRRRIFTKMYLEDGQKAYEDKDWSAAYENFKEYLGRNPDDLEILKKYAEARLSIRPLDGDIIVGAIAAYRRIVQLDPMDETAYEKLSMLYKSIGNFEELAYIARTKLENFQNDKTAPLWLAEALINLNIIDDAQKTLLKLIEDIEALPEKYPEYVQACQQISNVITSRDNSSQTAAEALEWLNKAVNYAPESVEALVNRAGFYCKTPVINGMSQNERLAAAHEDLDAVDRIGTEDPEILFLACSHWLKLGELDKAAAEIRAVDNLSQETIEKNFFDTEVSTVTRFLLACELAVRRGEITQAVSLADDALAKLTERRHRVQVLPSAINSYAAAGEVTKARSYLTEYLDSLLRLGETPVSSFGSSYLQALVAMAENKPYAAIDILKPAVVSDASAPELWRILADAYSQTDQPRLAVKALEKYRALYPQDPQIHLQLAWRYLALKDWQDMLVAAQKAESLNPADITAKLLRIEAEIHLVAEQRGNIDVTKLENLTAELQELRQVRPENVNIRMLQAVVAINRKQFDRAESELKLAIEECNEPLIAEMRLASYYYQNKRLPEAISLYEAACERYPDLAEPWLSLSELYVAEQDYNSARSCLKQGLDIVTDQQQKHLLFVRLALLEVLNGDRKAGIEILTNLTAQDEQNIQARLLLLGIREIQEDPAKAQKLIVELQKIEGQTGLLWRLHQASLLLSSSEWREKQQYITELLQYCIDSDPQWSSPVLLLANMYEKLEDFRRFEQTCRQAIARNPSASDIVDIFLVFLEKQERFTDAEDVLRQAKTNWEVANAWQIRKALRAGDLSQAVNELKLRASNDEQDIASRIQLARLIYLQTSDSNQAFTYLNEAEAINPNLPAITDMKASILKAEGRPQEALKVINDYVTDHNDFNAYWMRGLYLAGEGEYELAENDYKKLTTFTQSDASGYGLLCNFYLNRGKSDKALAAIEEGIIAYPEDLSLQRTLMKLLFSPGPLQDRSRAAVILASLEKKLPDDTEIMKFKAAELLENPTPQSSNTAKEILENIIKLEPTAVDVHLLLVDLAMQEADYQAARNFAIRALGSNQDNLELISARARAELALGETQLAVGLSLIVLRQDIRNAKALDIALKSNDRSDLEEVQKLIESALETDTKDEQMLLSRARVLGILGIPQNAISELEAYYQTDKGSGSVAALVTLADLYRLSGDMEKAGQRIEQAEQIEPDNLSVIHARFLWLVAQKRFDELTQISSAYQSAKQQNPATLMTAASILTSLDSMELVKEGLKLFEQAVTLSPRLLEARLGLASSLYLTGNAASAAEIYRELLKQYPDNIQAINDLAWIMQERNQYDAALDLINRGLTLAPDKLYMIDTRGTILFKLGRLSDSRGDFERLVKLAPSYTRGKAKSLLMLGRICAELKDVTNAKQYLQEALEIDRKIDVFTKDERSEIEKILQGN